MYALFRYKNIMPSDYYWRKPGEKKVIKAFFSQEIEDRKEEYRAEAGDV